MPQAALVAIKAFAVKFLTAKTIGFVIARTVLTNFVLSKISKALAPKQGSAGPSPINVTLRGTTEFRRLVFGTVRVGGLLTFYGASGTNNRFLWYVVVVAHHQVQAIRDVWLDTIRVPSADINPTTGAVSTAVFNNKLNIWRYTGTGAQTVQPDLDAAFTEWTSNHRLRGCAYVVVRMERDDAAFPQGPPQNITALVDGARLYDPRLDSTNGGSGSHRRTDPQTWAFSRNPALVARWILTGGSVVNDQASRLVKYGLRDDDARVDDAYIIAAANECDESVAGSNAPPSGAQPRYTCDIEFNTGQPIREWLQETLATMAGEYVSVKGKHRIYAGAYDTPLHTVTQDDVFGEIESQDTSSADDRYNRVAPIFIDGTQQYVEQTGAFRTAPAYETQDGEVIEKEIPLRGCTDPFRAQRLAEIDLRRSREMRVIQFTACRDLLKIAPYETFTFDHARWGWSGRVFRLIQRQFQFEEGAGEVVITARQIFPGTFTDLLTADYATGTSANDTRQVETPDAITAATATAFPQAIRFNLTLPGFYRAGSRIEVWEHTASTPFSSATLIGTYDSNVITIPKRDTTTRYYWFRVRAAAGGVSSEFPSGAGLAGTADRIVATDVSPNGLTVTYSSEDTGTTTIVTTSLIPTRTERLCTLNFTPDVDGDVTVTITYEAESDASNSPLVEAILRESGVNVATGTDNNPAATRGMAASQLEFSVTGGLTYTAALNVKQTVQPVTSVFYRIQTIVEYRRR
jgi:hypothetical protein